MPRRWLPAALARIRELARRRQVRFTLKGLRELAALDMGIDEGDACEVLARLSGGDCAGRLRSRTTGEWMYVFRPKVGEILMYVKVILRADCVVISFHEEEEDENREDR